MPQGHYRQINLIQSWVDAQLRGAPATLCSLSMSYASGLPFEQKTIGMEPPELCSTMALT